MHRVRTPTPGTGSDLVRRLPYIAIVFALEHPPTLHGGNKDNQQDHDRLMEWLRGQPDSWALIRQAGDIAEKARAN
jgi:hypothetical protein